jgi:EpsI family protein
MTNDNAARSLFQNKYARILSIAFVLQAALFYASPRSEAVPSMQPLRDFSHVFPGGWMMTEEGYVDDETQSVLKADDTLTRTYGNAKYGERANLFVAYFKTQRTGKAPHSPKNCLPGSGWEASTSDYLDVAVPGMAEPIHVNRYIVAKGEQKSVVLYWYQTQRRVVASEYRAKILSVEDAIRYNRTDTALVRVVVPFLGNDDEKAQREAVDFVQSFFTPLRAYLPA